INVGNISNSKSATGRKQMMDFIYLEEADVNALKALSEKGIKLEIKALPTDRGKDAIELIQKNY
ncbi:MAG: PTS sugar transporter subunit IIB, partial [Erysipelotrichaceae bacterium]